MKRSNRLSYSPVNLQDFTREPRKIRIEREAPGEGLALALVQFAGRMFTLPADSVTSIVRRSLPDWSTFTSREPALTSWVIA